MEVIICIFYRTCEIKGQDGNNFPKTYFGLVSILDVIEKVR
jgi:hypothetical protein